MAFKTLFMAHAPDADMEKHRAAVQTGKYHLFVVVVRNQAEALEVSREFRGREKIDSILLCPGFTHGDAAEIFAALENKVSVSVARGDGPGSRIAME
ncbi:MAG: DUF6506 family protein, partial [Candidatus Aminicenantes bacterium]|nr:DUF6506 family protein [Candidatus Aminicenantes bacterium]